MLKMKMRVFDEMRMEIKRRMSVFRNRIHNGQVHNREERKERRVKLKF